jgi:outer membrane beta-barrel protein
VASHRLVIAAALAAAVGAIAIAPRAARAQEAEKREARPTSICIDQEIADRLAVKRKRRKVVDRLFVKQARHELSLVGGYYVSDLFSSTYALGGAYTFHMTENTAVEMNVAFTHANADVIRAIEDERMQVLDDDFATAKFFESLLLWSPVYGKLRFGGSIARFDIHLDGGVGVVDSPTSRGAAGVAGIGLKLFAGQALAFRLDARDHVFKQELLDESFIVNDLSLTLGLSVFLPFSN